MRAALLCAFLAPLPVAADGPALAHLTLDGTTITLTETASIELGQEMGFAQMHLGFPLPPLLALTLELPTEAAPRLAHISLREQAQDRVLWFEPNQARVTATASGYLIETTALSRRPLGQFTPRPLLIDLHLTSP